MDGVLSSRGVLRLLMTSCFTRDLGQRKRLVAPILRVMRVRKKRMRNRSTLPRRSYDVCTHGCISTNGTDCDATMMHAVWRKPCVSISSYDMCICFQPSRSLKSLPDSLTVSLHEPRSCRSFPNSWMLLSMKAENLETVQMAKDSPGSRPSYDWIFEYKEIIICPLVTEGSTHMCLSSLPILAEVLDESRWCLHHPGEAVWGVRGCEAGHAGFEERCWWLVWNGQEWVSCYQIKSSFGHESWLMPTQ